MTARRFVVGILFLVVCFGVSIYAFPSPGTSVDLGTASSASNWLVTGAGATASPGMQWGGSVSISTTGDSTGTFITGGSAGAFNGFWLADRTFTIPAGATGVSLTVTALDADDRVLLQLNGTTIGNTGFYAPGTGQMRLTSGGTDDPYTFTNVTSGTISTGLVIGGSNTLRMIVNNTGNGIFGACTTVSSGNGTGAHVVATLTYTAGAVPALPGWGIVVLAAFLALAGLLATGGRRKRRYLAA